MDQPSNALQLFRLDLINMEEVLVEDFSIKEH